MDYVPVVFAVLTVAAIGFFIVAFLRAVDEESRRIP